MVVKATPYAPEATPAMSRASPPGSLRRFVVLPLLRTLVSALANDWAT